MTEQTDDDLRRAARATYGSDDIEIDDNAVVSRGDDGAFVAAWVWVRFEDEDEDEDDRIAACDQCGNTLNDGSDICDQCGGVFGHPV